VLFVNVPIGILLALARADVHHGWEESQALRRDPSKERRPPPRATAASLAMLIETRLVHHTRAGLIGSLVTYGVEPS